VSDFGGLWWSLPRNYAFDAVAAAKTVAAAAADVQACSEKAVAVPADLKGEKKAAAGARGKLEIVASSQPPRPPVVVGGGRSAVQARLNDILSCPGSIPSNDPLTLPLSHTSRPTHRVRHIEQQMQIILNIPSYGTSVCLRPRCADRVAQRE
jgi:hypothetical protein